MAPLRSVLRVGAGVLALLVVAAVLVGPSLTGSSGVQGKRERVVNVYSWSDYIDPQTLEDFTRETGIAIRYDTFDSNDVLETKLLTGNTGYDVVVPTGYFLERQIKAGVFQPLEKSKLPNLVNIWPAIAERLAVYDPGNRYAVDYMWGTTGVGFNVAKVKERLGGRSIESWDALFRPEEIAKFKDCGVAMLDSADDVLAAALHYLGLDPNSSVRADLERAAALVAAVRPAVRRFHSSDYINALASGDLCVVLGWSGDVKQAQKRAAEAGNGVAIGYAIPREGAQIFFDSFAIPKDAPHPDAAHAFIDFMLRPEVAARNTNILGYPNGNLASRTLVDPAILNDPAVYPSEEAMRRLYVLKAHNQKTQRLMNRLWTRVKTGR